MKYKGYVGTYTSGHSKGIYTFDLKDGILSNAAVLKQMRNPKYLCLDQYFIYAVNDMEKGSGVTVLDRAGTIVDSLAFEQQTSCYITTHNNFIYTVNFHAGSWSRLSFRNRHLNLEKQVFCHPESGFHELLFWKDSILVFALNDDRLLFYDQDGTPDGSIRFPEGTGPRHGVITRDQRLLYMDSELSNELFCIDLESRTILKQIPILENGLMHVKDTAAIRISSDEQYLYISTRTQDVISVIHLPEMKLVQTVSAGGSHPRDIWLQQLYLLVANRNSDSLVSMKLENGLIQKTVSEIQIPEPVSIILEEKHETE